MSDSLIYSNPVVIPSVPTLGIVGQHFNRSAVPSGAAGAYVDRIYTMVGIQQLITAPNISLSGTPPHVSYAGVAGIPTSDRQSC